MNRRPTLLAWGGFAVLVAGGVLLRSEAAIYFVLLGCCLGLFGLLGRRLDLIGLGVISIAVTLAAYTLDDAMRAAILGPGGDVSLSVPPEPLFDVRVRGALTWTWLFGSRPDFGLGRIIGAILLAVAALSARPGRSLNLSPGLGLVGALLYVPGLFSGSTMALFPTAPAILVGLALLARADRFVRLYGLLAVLYFGAVVATSYANGGGGDWGGRYLAMLLAPLAIIALPEVWLLGQRSPAEEPDRRNRSPRVAAHPLLLGVLVATVALAASMSVDVIGTRRRTAELAEQLTVEIESETDANDVVVSIDGRIGRLLGDTDVDARLFQVPPDSVELLLERIATDEGLVIVDPFQTFEPPDGWTVEERSENLIRVIR